MEWIKIFDSEKDAKVAVEVDKPRLLLVKDKRICLALHDGQFFAVQDACTHNGESLSKGKINFLGEIICPWHNYRFQLSTGQACDSSCRDLVTYDLEWKEDGVYIRL